MAAVDALLADWDEGEATAVREARDNYTTDPGFETARALSKALHEWEPPPVQVVWQDIGGGTSQIVKYVRSTLDAPEKRGGIDLLFGGGTDIYLGLAKEGFLQPVDMPAALLERIPPEINGFPLYDSKHRWFGPMLSGFGILSNCTVFERIGEPMSEYWHDLGRPGLARLDRYRRPRLTGSVHGPGDHFAGPGLGRGSPLLLRLGANTHAFTRDSGTRREVILGEVAAAGSIDVQALSAVRSNAEMKRFELPGGETVVNPDALAVLVRGPGPQLARALFEFTLSDAGQRLVFLRPGQPGGPPDYPLCRLSVLPSFYREYPPEARSTGPANPFELKSSVQYDKDLGERRWNPLNDLFGAWVIDAHPDLRDAWAAVCAMPPESPERSRLEAELFAPPCTEAELTAYGRTLAQGDPRVRTEAVTRWGEQARERYRRVRKATGQ